MVVPVFSGRVSGIGDVAPMQIPVESLSSTNYLKGIEVGKDLPTTATAITRGLQDLVQNQQTYDINDLKIQKARQDLQNAPIDTAQAKATLAETQARTELEKQKLAQEIADRKKQDEFTAIFEGSDNQAKVEAVTSGRFADIFGENPHLEQSAIRMTLPYMSPAQQDAFELKTRDDAQRKLLLNHQAKVANTYTQKNADLIGDSDVDKIVRENPSLKDNIPALINNPDRYQVYQTGEKQLGENGELIAVKGFDAAQAGKPTYQIYDSQLKKFTSKNIPESVKKKINDARSAKIQYRQMTGSYGSSPEDTMAQIEQRKKQLAAQQSNILQPETAPPAQKSLRSLPEELNSVPLVSKEGAPAIKNNELLNAKIMQGLNLKPEVAKKLEKSIGQVTSDLHEEISDIASSRLRKLQGVEREEQLKYLNDNRDTLVRQILSNEFESDKENYKEQYNEETVRAHNEAVKRWGDALEIQRKNLAQGVSTNLYSLLKPGDYFGRLAGVYKEVSTPEELYIEKNYPRIAQKLSNIFQTILDSTQKQATKKINSGQTINELAAIASQVK